MAIRLSFVLLLLALALVVKSSPLSGDAYWNVPFVGGGDGFGSTETCNDFDGECNADSGITRRSLIRNKFLSYGALKKDNVPCSQRGASYYNCHRASKVNPYRRGCSRQTQCKRDLD